MGAMNSRIPGIFILLGFLSCTPDGATVVSRFVVPGGSAVADGARETVLLTVPRPFANRNGGQLSFGPDGYLYIGAGYGNGTIYRVTTR